MALFMKIYSDYTILSADSIKQSWQEEPDSVVEVKDIEQFKNYLESCHKNHEIIHRIKSISPRECLGKIGFVWDFYNK